MGSRSTSIPLAVLALLLAFKASAFDSEFAHHEAGGQIRSIDFHSSSLHISWEDIEEKHEAKGPAQPPGPEAQLLSCFAHKQVPKPVTWESATSTKGYSNIPTLKVVGVWESEEQATANQYVTLVTSGTLDRLNQLYAQCKSWDGLLSAALFVGLVQEAAWPLTAANRAILHNAVGQVSKFMSTVQKATPAALASGQGMCRPSILLTYEVYAEQKATLLYPINILRNYARIQAHTPLVAMLDIDLLPSRTLLNRAAVDGPELVKKAQDKTVFIVPAFDMTRDYETASWAEALTSAPDKGIMSVAAARKLVSPFHVQRFATGHRLTNFSKWETATADYVVKYEPHCEPWVVGDRLKMPWHDVRYRGYGFNKMQYTGNLDLEGFKFTVLHNVYAIHRPHDTMETQRLFMQRTALGKHSLRQYVEGLYTAQAAAGSRYRAIVSPAELRCRSELPWWAGHRRRQLATHGRIHGVHL